MKVGDVDKLRLFDTVRERPSMRGTMSLAEAMVGQYSRMQSYIGRISSWENERDLPNEKDFLKIDPYEISGLGTTE